MLYFIQFLYTMKKTVKILFIISFVPILLTGQINNQTRDVRVTELEVQNQQKFINGLREQQLGKIENAAKLFQEVLDKDPACDACAFHLSRVYILLNKPIEAYEAAKKTAVIDPKNKWYKLNLAEVMEKLGKEKEASNVYKSLAETSAFNSDYIDEIYFRWAFCEVRLGDNNKALKILDDLENKTGINENVVEKKRILFEAIGQPAKAALELEKLASNSPNNTEYQYQAAAYYAKIGDNASAKKIYKRLLIANPNDAKAQLALASQPTSANTGGDNATNVLQNLKPLFAKPDVSIDDKIKAILPYTQQIAENKDKNLSAMGLELAQILEKTHPNDPKTYALLGDMYLFNEKEELSVQAYKKCIALNPSIYSVWEHLLFLENKLFLYDDLLKTSEQVTDLFPNEPYSFYMNGTALEKKGRNAEALPMYEQALLMSGKNVSRRVETLMALGTCTAKIKTGASPDKYFEEAQKLSNNAPYVGIRFANALMLRNEKERAVTIAEYSLKNASLDDALFLEAYGDYLFRAGDTEKALTYWQNSKQKGLHTPSLDKKISDKMMVE